MNEKRCMEIDGKRVLIVGTGKTGLAAARALENRAEKMFITDTRCQDEIASSLQELSSVPALFVTMDSVFEKDIDIVITSPGISIDHPVLQEFRNQDVPVIAEIEAAYSMMSGRIVAVTGTNGKTTTTSLIGEILKAHFSDVRIAGNIGNPFIKAVRDSGENTVFVVEVSSYQLEGIRAFHPVVAVILNVTPDHMDRHLTVERYAAAKARVLENQNADDVVVLNFDDPIVRKMAASSQGKTLFFGTLDAGIEGAYTRDDSIMIRFRDEELNLMSFSEVPLKGSHNRENVMAAGLSAGWLGVPWEVVRRQVVGFRGLEHRMEPVAEIDGVSFVNDSKSTNAAASIAALRSFEPGRIVIILGGDDKGLEYDELIREISGRAKHVILMGDGLTRLIDEIRHAGFKSTTNTKTMEEAVSKAKSIASEGDVVLLSPASSSFDLFENYEERGRAFKDVVRLVYEVKKTD